MRNPRWTQKAVDELLRKRNAADDDMSRRKQNVARVEGMKEAANFVLDEAAKLFRFHKDDAAKEVRFVAWHLERIIEQRREAQK